MSYRLDVQCLRDVEPRRICVIKPSALGDVVQALPVLEGLRARWPTAEITWVIRDDLADLVNRHPLIDEWLPYQRRGGLRAWAGLLRQLRSRRFDLTVDLQGLLRSGLMTLATGARWRVGLETAREASALAHNIVLPNTGRDVPAHARYLLRAKAIGQSSRHAPRDERCGVGVERFAKHARTGEGALITRSVMATLAVHPAALWATKRWPVGRFAAVAGRAVRELGMRIVVVGGPNERDLSRRFVDSLRASVPSAEVSDLTGATTIAELTDVLRQVDLLLTNDSGPMHLAASVGTPVVGVFTSTSSFLSGPSLETGPDGPKHQLVATPTACGGCYRRRCPLPGQQKNTCQRDLSVDRVWQALVRCAEQNRLLDGLTAAVDARRHSLLHPLSP